MAEFRYVDAFGDGGDDPDPKPKPRPKDNPTGQIVFPS